ncbi:MAG: hypothetical protein ABJH72_23260 [Reichenbachiella sp.]|uniref:hypothetical protein n=1 Tax=Reichenbachiella sp. TaxID=2184521 RepID=UPI003265F19E
MKSLKSLLLVIGIIFTSCIGPQGLEGLPGRDGLDGIDGTNGEESFVFEYEFSFTATDYSVLLNLPTDFTMLDSDVILVYLLWEIKDDIEIWRALPQTLYFEDGLLHYNYDFTKFDANIFLDGTVNLDGLGAAYTDNWVARIVVVPGQFASGRTAIDLLDYNQVREYYDLSPSKLATAEYATRPN